MVESKLIFLYFVAFPLGQIIRINLGKGIVIHPIDILVCLMAISVFFIKKRPAYFTKLKILWGFLILSLVCSLAFFDTNKLLIGSLYLARFISYGLFSIFIWKFATKEKAKNKILNSLLIIGVFVALFGFCQYFF